MNKHQTLDHYLDQLAGIAHSLLRKNNQYDNPAEVVLAAIAELNSQKKK